MNAILILKVCAIWLLIAVVAIGNGVVRAQALIPALGTTAGLLVSGVSLSVIVFCVTYSAFNWFGRQRGVIYVAIGLQWVLMTLAFEFLFGHYVGGKSWSDILIVFNIAKGDLFLVVLVVTLLSPWVVAKLKGVLKDD